MLCSFSNVLELGALPNVRNVLLLAVLAGLAPARTAAAQGEGCAALGRALTEHTCFHARLGPFAARTASDGESVVGSTPNVNPVHTYYRVAVPPGRASTVTYEPARSGAWAFFVEPDVPFTIRDPLGAPVAYERVVSDGSCPFLGDARVASLEARSGYALTFGASTTSEVLVVIEKVDDFIGIQGRDSDGDGFGDPNSVIVDACVTRPGYAPNDYDCDDEDPTVHPRAQEICDGVDADCDGNVDDIGSPCTAGIGACAVTGISSCPTPGAPAVCSAMPGAPAAEDVCNNVDDDCDGNTDEDGDRVCSADPVRPLCVSIGTGNACGCESDADCGGPTSARLCFLRETVQQCIAGCVDAFGRNACPAGERCTSKNPAAPGTCVPDERLDAGVEMTDAGVEMTDAGVEMTDAGFENTDGGGHDTDSGGGTPADAAAGAPDAGSDGASRSGCSCSAAGSQRPSGAAFAVALVLAMLTASRSPRARRMLACVALLVSGCYQAIGVPADSSRLDAPDSSRLDASDSSRLDAPDSSGPDSAQPDAVLPAPDSALDAALADVPLDAPPACLPALGARLVNHACQHGELGPFNDVVATPGGELPPEVSTSHHTYILDLRFGERVRYRPSREGSHILFIEPEAVVVILDETGETIATTTADTFDCGYFSTAVVASLEVGAAYVFELASPADEVRVFVEHPDTFGADAWERSCE